MGTSTGATWSIDDIPYGTLARESVRDDRRLFDIVASASFIEITSDLYTRNLVEFFRADREVADWLAEHWQREELQHGAALRKYVETAWPDFDWQAGYRLFLADYGPTCTVQRLAPSKALEMASRCVIETGTATFYRALSDLSPEPVLKRLAAEISAPWSAVPPTSRRRTPSMPTRRCSACATRRVSSGASTTTPTATA